VESTIVDCTVAPPLVRRAGGVTMEQLTAVVAEAVLTSHESTPERAQVAPGQLLRHYAPAAPVTVFAGAAADVVRRLAAEARHQAASGRRVGVLAPDEDLLSLAPALAAAASRGRIVVASLGQRGTPAEAAQRLFAALRALDAEGVEVIVAAGPDRHGLGVAVWDRLQRAAEGRVVRV
jgi:L-threonylcarbamoyladenylate synthase